MNIDTLTPLVLDLFIKDSIVLVFALLLLQIWSGVSAAQRCLVWSLVFIVLLALPATRLAAPHWAFSLPGTNLASTTYDNLLPAVSTRILAMNVTSTSHGVRIWPTLDWTKAVIGAYTVGCVLLIGYRFIGVFLLTRFHRASSALQNTDVATLASSIATEYRLSRPVEVRISAACHVPVTWGTLHPTVMLPNQALEWPCERLKSALRHEMGHIKNFDHLTRWIAFLACTFYWPNPFVWLASKKLQVAQEEASDDLVLKIGISPQTYAAQLIETIQTSVGRNVLSMPAIAMARSSTLESRISAILDGKRNRDPYSPRLVVMGIGSVLVLSAVSGAAQLRGDTPTSQAAGTSPAPIAKRAATNPANLAKMTHKVDTLIIPKVDFKDASVEDVLRFLQAESNTVDPDHEGITFVLKQNKHPMFVTITLTNISIRKALDYLTQMTNLKYSIGEYAVYFFPNDESSELMLVRSYRNLPDGFLGLKPDASGNIEHYDVKQAFENRGIKFLVGAVAAYFPKTKPLVVRNTADQLDLIEAMLKPQALKNSSETTP